VASASTVNVHAGLNPSHLFFLVSVCEIVKKFGEVSKGGPLL